MFNIFLGSDHAGFETKEFLKKKLEAEGYTVVDHGALQYDQVDDYPDFVIPVAKSVASHPGSRGIVLGYSGQGEAMGANRVKGIRAAVYYGGEKEIITLSREHNDANILSLGAGFISDEEAWSVVEIWLNTTFSGAERHVRRIKKIDD